MRIESIREEARKKHELKMLRLESEQGAKEARRLKAEGDRYVYDIKALKAKAQGEAMKQKNAYEFFYSHKA